MWIVTALWIVGITNAMNLMDGLDGLAAGIGCDHRRDAHLHRLAGGRSRWACSSGLAFLGALLGFLPYNFPPARIFLGDTGALFIGFNLSLLALEGYRQAVAAHLRGAAARARRAADGHHALDLRRLRRRTSILSRRPPAHAPPPARRREGSHRAAVLSIWFLTACFCLIAVSFTQSRGIGGAALPRRWWSC